jgi:hypothetical protein
MRYAGIVLKLLHMCTHKSSVSMLHILCAYNITTYVSSHYNMCAQKSKRLENGGAAGPRKGEVRFVFPCHLCGSAVGEGALLFGGGILFCI